MTCGDADGSLKGLDIRRRFVMTTETVTAPAPPTTGRRRAGVLAAVLAVATVAAIPANFRYPRPAEGATEFGYADIAPIRETFWALQVFLSVEVALAVPAMALAVLLLVRHRGATLATIGATALCVGAACYVVGSAGIATFYYFTTDPALLDPGAGARLVEEVSTGWKLYALAAPGMLLLAVGTVLQAIALWRSRSVPRWLPIASLSIVAGFFIPTSGWTGLVVQAPIVASGLAVAYFVWRRRAVRG